MRETLQMVLAQSLEERQAYINEHPTVLQDMLAHIGDPNGELRDQLNYRLFMELLSANQIPHAQLEHIAVTLVQEAGLLYGLDEVNTDAVYTRSFAALWLTAILHADRQLRILPSDTIQAITMSAVKLFQRERDLRSFVSETHGWAHSVAHVSDLAVALIQHPDFSMHNAPQLLQGIKAAFWKGYVFTDDEEERFTKIVEAIIAKGFEEDVLVEWVEQVFDRLEMSAYERGYTQEWFKARTNILHFMKNLYFTLKFSNRYDKLRGVISIFIQRWMKLS
ncbi:DUF2785 domain-containing protein [Lysinibacillus sp. KU-BSD001]|uniref:DUF2785 domain-containing protein n=1 Tax=Lysinibacillus sp. KU-BSD001 TaxID=3141328 RepID=UPI0036E1592F